jgi:hypothetical protein
VLKDKVVSAKKKMVKEEDGVTMLKVNEAIKRFAQVERIPDGILRPAWQALFETQGSLPKNNGSELAAYLGINVLVSWSALVQQHGVALFEAEDDNNKKETEEVKCFRTPLLALLRDELRQNDAERVCAMLAERHSAWNDIVDELQAILLGTVLLVRTLLIVACAGLTTVVCHFDSDC